MKILPTLFLLLFLFPTHSHAQQAQLTKEYKAFDFWLGEWEVYGNASETPTATSKIESVIDSFAIQENYSVIGNPYQGKSFNKYNPVLQRWEQFWVDNSGTSLFIHGNLDENGRMVMGNEFKDSDGNVNRNEISWEKLENGNVVQTWRLKNGEGEWSILFSGIYKPKKNK